MRSMVKLKSHVGLVIYIFQEDLYDLAHVAMWEPYYLHDLARVSGVGSVLHIYRSCTTSHNGIYGIYFV